MDSACIVETTAETFWEDVIKRSWKSPVLVDYWAPWCGACKSMTPALEAAVVSRKGELFLAKIDIDSEHGLAATYHIYGIPHVQLFRNGYAIAEFTGVRSLSAIEKFLDESIGHTFSDAWKSGKSSRPFSEIAKHPIVHPQHGFRLAGNA